MAGKSPKAPLSRIARSLIAFVPAMSVAALVAISVEGANGQTAAPGLTGAAHTDDVVMARQLLMDGVDTEMGVLEGKIDLAGLKDRAYRINTLLSAFPHLFPPETKPTADLSTAATPAVWQDFDGFYDKVQAAAGIAFDASQAGDSAKLTASIKSLRTACDSCHEVYMHAATP